MGRSVRDVLMIRGHRNMAISLSKEDFCITAFNFDNNPLSIDGDCIEKLASMPGEYRDRTFIDNIRDITTLSKTIKSIHPDIVHVNALQDLVSTYLARTLTSFQGLKPAIIAMSRSAPAWKNPIKARMYSKVIRFFSDGFVAMSSTHKEQLLLLGVPSKKLTVIPNSYDPQQMDIFHSSPPRKTNHAIRILYVANICENKAQDILIHAASFVVKKHPDVKFELIGKVVQGEEAYAEKLKSLIEHYGLEGSIHLTGGIPYKDVLSSLLGCDLFVFPTYSEMMPRAVIEAMVFGLPVIASGVDGILDLIEHRKSGLLVQPGNIEELECSICELIENPGLANSVGLSGQKYVMEHCSPEKVGRQFREFYEYILNR